MKQGDKVVLIDESYQLTIGEEKLTHPSALGGYYHGNDLIIIATGCKLPADNSYPCRIKQVNDTIVYSKTKDMYFFAQERFLRLKKNFCSECGHQIG